MTVRPLDQSGFRRLFPALSRAVWLDTPGSPPGATLVTDALRTALDNWSTGEFSWLNWDRAPASCREQVAAFLGVPTASVAIMGSVAEAAATVAASLPPGRVVVPADEFRSNLYPWQALDPGRHQLVLVPGRDGSVRTEDLIAEVDDRTVLLAISEVLTSTGVRADLPALRAATASHGARLFVDASQSQGVLRIDFDELCPDFVAVHGYKWMLCPRGAAWLVVRDDRVAELSALAPSWHSDPEHGYFGGVLRPQPGAARCDTSASWLPWIGAGAALDVHRALDPEVVERHCLRLAALFTEAARELGYRPVADGAASHVVVLRHGGRRGVAEAFAAAGVRANVLPDRLRVGFHFFNTDQDLDTAITALRSAAT